MNGICNPPPESVVYSMVNRAHWEEIDLEIGLIEEVRAEYILHHGVLFSLMALVYVLFWDFRLAIS